MVRRPWEALAALEALRGTSGGATMTILGGTGRTLRNACLRRSLKMCAHQLSAVAPVYGVKEI